MKHTGTFCNLPQRERGVSVSNKCSAHKTDPRRFIVLLQLFPSEVASLYHGYQCG